MKFFGHPVHLMLIHFPSALLPMELVCYFLYFYTRENSFALAAFYAMAGAVAFGWVAAITGLFDLAKIPPEKPVVMKTALLHAGFNVLVITVYTVLAYVLYKKYPQLPQANIIMLIVKIILVMVLFTGNYFGGKLVLKYRLGAES